MWSPLLAAVIALGLLAAGELDARRLVQNARNEKELRDAVARIEASETDLAQDVWLASTICERWEAFGRPEKGRALLESLKGRVDAPSEPERLCLLSSHLERTGRVDEAVAAAREALDRAREGRGQERLRDAEQRALKRLAESLEAQGSHREALATYSEWRPRSWCGTCADEIGQERTIAIARCHVALDEIDRALALLEDGAVESRGAQSLLREMCIVAGTHGRMDGVRSRLARDDVSSEVRVASEPFLRLGDVLESRDPAAMLRVAASSQRDGKALAALGRAYSTLDEDAIEELCKRVVRGEMEAILLVEHGRIRAAARAVRSRIALHPEQRGHLERVLREL